MEDSRTHNSIVNIGVGILCQLLITILAFISRKIFINVLSIEYLGINGLFSNVLEVLSLAELGISSAIIYSMYQAIANKDQKKLNALTNYYKKLYTKISIAIAGIGVLLLPFLDYIINLDSSIPNVKWYYLIFLMNSVVSYLFVYKTSIVMADQKEYRLKYVTICFSIVRTIIQIVVLIMTKNYLLYLLVQVLGCILENYIKSRMAEKWYPYIKGEEQIEEKDRTEIWKNIKAMFCYKVGGVALNSTDNIIISALIGTAVVGYYSNYSMVITKISSFTSLLFTSLQASIGNLNTLHDEKRNYFIFRVLVFAAFWIFAFTAVCFFVLFNDFITIFFGAEYLLESGIVFICVLNYYIQGILYPIWCFRQTTGLFQHTKYVMLFATMINLVLSVIMGMKWELIGVLIATAISRIVTTIWYEPYILFKKFFKESFSKYIVKQISYFLLFAVVLGITTYLAAFVVHTNEIFVLLFKLILCIVIPNIIFLCLFHRTEEFQYLYKKMISSFLYKKEK